MGGRSTLGSAVSFVVVVIVVWFIWGGDYAITDKQWVIHAWHTAVGWLEHAKDQGEQWGHDLETQVSEPPSTSTPPPPPNTTAPAGP